MTLPPSPVTFAARVHQHHRFLPVLRHGFSFDSWAQGVILEPSLSAQFVPMTLTHRDCPSCGSAASTRLPYGRAPWSTVSCSSCGLVYMPDVPAIDAVGDDFEWTRSFAAEKAHRAKARPKLAKVDRLTRARLHLLGKREPMAMVRRYVQHGRIVDLGCGEGGYLGKSADGFIPYGVDISPVLAPMADRLFRQAGGEAICAPCDEGLLRFEPNFFDAAILRSYLEHEHRPRAVLEALFARLRPGGVAIVKVPNYGSLNRRLMGGGWCGFRFPDHVNYFTPRTLRDLAARAGFATHMRWHDRLPTDDNMWAVLQKPAG